MFQLAGSNQGGHSAVTEVFFYIFPGPEKSMKMELALKVLKFDTRGRWKSLKFNTSESSLPRCQGFAVTTFAVM